MENPNQLETPTTQNPQTSPTPAFGINKVLLLTVFVLILVIVGGGAYILGTTKNSLPDTPIPTLVSITSDTSTPTPTLIPTLPPSTSTPAAIPIHTPIPTKASTNPNLKTYASQTLGISFNYLETQPDTKEKVSIKEIGNKVYVYMGNTPTQGQSAEVFNKDKANSLEAAIKKQFLSNISENDCFVVNTTSKYKFPSTYQVAEISFPYDKNSDVPMFAQENKCPPTYTQSNGMSFFLSDTNHPTSYFFFSIGQYGISADQGKMWQETVQFLN